MRSAPPPSGTGLAPWQAALPLLLVVVVLGALAVRDAARLLLPGSLVAAPTIALLVTLASLFGYVTTNYFLAQLLVMPLVLGELLVLHWIAGQSGWRDRLGGLVLLLAIVVVALLSYSPLPFLMQPVILAAVCIGELGRGWLRQSAIVVVATVGAFAAAFVLVPAPIWQSVKFVRVASSGAKRGWPLGLMTPSDMLGLRQVVRTPRPIVGMFVFQGLIVGIVVLAAVSALWHERRRAAIFQAGVAFIVLGSYAAVYAARGYSYEQWKWISFFQPTFMTAVFSLVVAASGAVGAEMGTESADRVASGRGRARCGADRGIGEDDGDRHSVQLVRSG